MSDITEDYLGSEDKKIEGILVIVSKFYIKPTKIL